MENFRTNFVFSRLELNQGFRTLRHDITAIIIYLSL